MHSGLMCLDFDDIEDIDGLKQLLLRHDYFDTELLFVSPSGNGLKWIIPVDLQGWEHSRYFKAVSNRIKATGLPSVDMSVSDMARSCFLPYGPQAYINPKYKDDVEENLFCPRLGDVLSEIQQTHTPSIALIYNKVKEDVESVVREIERRAIDIAPNYRDWVELGFALVDGLGENGREYHHRISRVLSSLSKGRNRQTIYAFLIFEKKDYYFGSISAIYTVLNDAQIGIKQSSLLHAGLTDGGIKITRRAIIRQSHLIRCIRG